MRCWWTILLATAVLATEPQTYVVAVGVESYKDANISTLKCSVGDAKAFAEAFLKAGVPAANVTLLTSDQTDHDRLPRKSDILFALQRYRGKAVEADTLIFFFAGHGVEQDGQAWLLTFDSVREQLADTALPMRAVNSILQGLQAKQVLFLIDACRNDPRAARADQDAVLSEGLARGMRQVVTSAPGQGPAAALLLACDVGQRAYEIPEEDRGAFTYFLLRGLAGEAKSADGSVTVNSLAAYVTREVSAWAARNRREQTPRYTNPREQDFAVLPARLAPPATPPTPTSSSGSGPAILPVYLAQWRAQMPANLRYRIRAQDNMPQVLIPQGEVRLGSAPTEVGRRVDEGPQRLVTVSAFWLDQHEVTEAQYRRFCEVTGRPQPAAPEWGWQVDHPVVNVDWEDAHDYARWVGARLPTEAEWERAARGGAEDGPYVWGVTLDAGRTKANLKMADPYPYTSPVGAFAPNDLGVFDLAGNVWEWCQDWYAADWYQRLPERDPVNTTPAEYRAMRGGSWMHDDPAFIRIAGRRGLIPVGHLGPDLGFRCAGTP